MANASCVGPGGLKISKTGGSGSWGSLQGPQRGGLGGQIPRGVEPGAPARWFPEGYKFGPKTGFAMAPGGQKLCPRLETLTGGDAFGSPLDIPSTRLAAGGHGRGTGIS